MQGASQEKVKGSDFNMKDIAKIALGRNPSKNKAKICNHCGWWSVVGTYCVKGHSPRCYYTDQLYATHKRRCTDFIKPEEMK
jgi:hypothetical protein